METSAVIGKELSAKDKVSKIVQTKCFPTLEAKCTPEKLKLNTQFSINQALLSDTAFHKETLDRLGLLKPKEL